MQCSYSCVHQFLTFQSKLQGKDNALMWMRKHTRDERKSLVSKLIPYPAVFLPSFFLIEIEWVYWFNFFMGWWVVLCLGSTEELLRFPKSHLRTWVEGQEVSYQIFLLPQVSRSGSQSLGFFTSGWFCDGDSVEVSLWWTAPSSGWRLPWEAWAEQQAFRYVLK